MAYPTRPPHSAEITIAPNATTRASTEGSAVGAGVSTASCTPAGVFNVPKRSRRSPSLRTLTRAMVGPASLLGVKPGARPASDISMADCPCGPRG